jgi:hypothetical protein
MGMRNSEPIPPRRSPDEVSQAREFSRCLSILAGREFQVQAEELELTGRPGRTRS